MWFLAQEEDRNHIHRKPKHHLGQLNWQRQQPEVKGTETIQEVNSSRGPIFLHKGRKLRKLLRGIFSNAFFRSGQKVNKKETRSCGKQQMGTPREQNWGLIKEHLPTPWTGRPDDICPARFKNCYEPAISINLSLFPFSNRNI